MVGILSVKSQGIPPSIPSTHNSFLFVPEAPGPGGPFSCCSTLCRSAFDQFLSHLPPSHGSTPLGPCLPSPCGVRHPLHGLAGALHSVSIGQEGHGSGESYCQGLRLATSEKVAGALGACRALTGGRQPFVNFQSNDLQWGFQFILGLPFLKGSAALPNKKLMELTTTALFDHQ